MNDLRNIVDTTLVPHAAFEEASRRLDQCFHYAHGANEPICIAVIGESRTGKSRAIEDCYSRNMSARSADGLEVPILRVKTPSKPTVKSLAELMLRAMSDPLFDKGTENAKTTRLHTLMRNCQTKMVMIDEFQHFVDKGSHKVMHHVADWLKVLVDDAQVALVVAGLPSCQAVLEQNEQLSGRFMSPVRMPRFDWSNDPHREQFLDILGAFHESIGCHFDMPALDGPDLSFRCFCATGGLMGYLTKLLRQAVWDAIDRGSKTIDLAALAHAQQQAVWSKDGPCGIANPFTREFQATPTSELIERILSIGVAQEPPRPSRRRSTAATERMTTRSVLSAT